MFPFAVETKQKIMDLKHKTQKPRKSNNEMNSVEINTIFMSNQREAKKNDRYQSVFIFPSSLLFFSLLFSSLLFQEAQFWRPSSSTPSGTYGFDTGCRARSLWMELQRVPPIEFVYRGRRIQRISGSFSRIASLMADHVDPVRVPEDFK